MLSAAKHLPWALEERFLASLRMTAPAGPDYAEGANYTLGASLVRASSSEACLPIQKGSFVSPVGMNQIATLLKVRAKEA